MTGVLLETELTSEQREYAGKWFENPARGLLTVINDILDFLENRGRAGSRLTATLPFDLRAVLEEVVEILAPRAEEKSIDLILSYPASLPHSFVGDVGRESGEVVTNLLGNALKFTPRGHVLVSVGMRSTLEPRRRPDPRCTGFGHRDRDSARKDLLVSSRNSPRADASTTRKYGGDGAWD